MIPAEVVFPTIRLWGQVNEGMLARFMDAMDNIIKNNFQSFGVELFTGGGEAETGRRIALEIRLAGERGIHVYFIGKTMVYSAGVTIMAAFPRGNRYLSKDCVLLIHGRNMEKTVTLSGPIKASLLIARSLVSEIETGLALEQQGFRELIDGTEVLLDEVAEKAQGNWYVTAEEALERGLVAGLL